ncbi:MAG: hypothetical protein R2828_20350 [Saprospiraceae bacterium]
MKSAAPPLYIWGIVLGLVAIVFISLSSSLIVDKREGHGGFYRNFKTRLAHLKATSQVSKEDEVVVILGTSYTAMGINHHDYFYNRFKNERERSVHVFKIYMYSCSSDDFQDMPEYFEAALSLKPDILCLEERLLAFEERHAETQFIPKWIDDFQLGANAIKENLLLKMGKGKSDEPGYFDFFWPYHNESYAEDSTLVAPHQFDLRSFKENKKVNHWLAELKKQKTAIVLLNIPRPKPTEDALLEAKTKPAFEAFMHDYESAFALKHWEFPEPLPFKLFSGDTHLNEKGMMRYSEWLFQQIDTHFHP